jgi:ribosomal protein S3
MGIRGVMIKCSGRFTRKQRATNKVFKLGLIGLSTIQLPLNYFFGTTALKFGAVGIKVYLLKYR